MGLDYSLHAVDPKLFRERLVPYAMGLGDISDLIERAVQVALVREQAAAWCKATYNLSKVMREDQQKVAPTIKHRLEKPARQGFLAKLLGPTGRAKAEEYEARATVPVIPGFDDDLTIWGRPFFNTAEGGAAGMAGHQSFMAAAGKLPEEIEALCRNMLADLDARRSQIPPDTDAAVAAVLARSLPYVDAVKVVSRRTDMGRMRKGFAAEWSVIRKIWDQRNAKEVDFEKLELEAREEVGLSKQDEESGWINKSDPSAKRTLPSGPETVAGLPLRIAGFAASLEPGWMGRGYPYASSSLRKIKVDPKQVFETPARLFEELIITAPTGRWRLRDTVRENFSLGGYVRPEKVPMLVKLLENNKDALIRAWSNNPPIAFDLEEGLVSYLKNLEPAMYAASKGWGYLEAAEIYSGFLGWAN